MAFDKASYDKDYVKANYSRFGVYVPKDKADALRALAKTEGTSVNRLFLDAIRKLYGLDLSSETDGG